VECLSWMIMPDFGVRRKQVFRLNLIHSGCNPCCICDLPVTSQLAIGNLV